MTETPSTHITVTVQRNDGTVDEYLVRREQVAPYSIRPPSDLKPAIRCPRCGWREGYGAGIITLDLLNRLYDEHFRRTHTPLPIIERVPISPFSRADG